MAPSFTRRIARAGAVLALLVLPATASALMVSVAASLRDVVSEIGRDFEADTGVAVHYNFGGSGALAQQIERGAPTDVFVSAGWPQIERLQREDLIGGEPAVIAGNRLVVIVPRDSTWKDRSVEALLRSADVTRIATGDPALVPFGTYAKQALDAARLWEIVAAKAVFATDVRQAVAYADRGAVDAAIVYATDARIAKTAVLAGDLPGSEGLRIEAVAARIRRSTDPAAERFLAALVAERARAVFLKYGFVDAAR